MRKTQIALAAVALVASSAALADVKVAGCVDAAVVNTTAGTVLAGGGDGCASQFGVYGSEDIGGLKASYNLELGFSTANGAMANGGRILAAAPDTTTSQSVFNRLANVGLGTKEATVTLGMAKSAWIEAAGGGLTAYGMNGVGVPALVIINPGLSGTTQSGAFFVGNIVGLSGDLGVASYNLQQAVNSASATSDSYSALRVSSNVGPATVNYGYEKRKNLALASNDVNLSNWVISGSLPLDGGFSVNAAYAKQSVGTGHTASTESQTGYVLGAGYKMSEALGLGVTYAKNTATTSVSMLALSGQYNFSARTAGYLNYSDFTNAAWNGLNNGGTAQTSALGAYSGRVISVGMQHAF